MGVDVAAVGDGEGAGDAVGERLITFVGDAVIVGLFVSVVGRSLGDGDGRLVSVG